MVYRQRSFSIPRSRSHKGRGVVMERRRTSGWEETGDIFIAGIDVGFTGAISFYHHHPDRKRLVMEVYDMPVIKIKKGKKTSQEIDESVLRQIFAAHKLTHVFIEKAQTMSDQGISSAGRYMCGFGILRGICVGMQVPYTLVRPQQWKKIMMSGMSKGKGQSIVRVKQLFPLQDLPLKSDHGKADAILIACYGAKEMGY